MQLNEVVTSAHEGDLSTAEALVTAADGTEEGVEWVVAGETRRHKVGESGESNPSTQPS